MMCSNILKPTEYDAVPLTNACVKQVAVTASIILCDTDIHI